MGLVGQPNLNESHPARYRMLLCRHSASARHGKTTELALEGVMVLEVRLRGGENDPRVELHRF
jgi:hypothetical protein